MSNESGESWKDHRRAVPPQPGSTVNRVIVISLIALYAIITNYYLQNYRKNELPSSQITALTICHSVYSFRTSISFMVFMKNRNFSRSHAMMLVFIIMPLFTFVPVLTAKPMENGSMYIIAWILYLIGSIIHTTYEFQRFMWKSDGQNKGKLFTNGLAAFCRNPNYLGDILLFEGWYLASNNVWNQVIPIFIIYNFMNTLIPKKEEYLKMKYSSE
eukprot:UN12534